MLPRRKILLIAILITSLVSFTSLFNNPELSVVHPVHAASVHFTLYADYSGWNYTKPSGINPTITVTQGDSVSLTLIGQDALTHLFLLDLDGNGGSVYDCPSPDICSVNVGTGQTVTVPSFTANFALGVYKYYCYYHFTTMVGNFVVQGFKINSSPTSLTVNQGSSVTSTVTLTSVNNFAGTVGLAASVLPGGPAVSMSPSSATLTAGGSTTSTLTFSAMSGTPSGTYTVTVTGTSGSASSTASVTATVSAPVSPDFTIASSPTSLNIPQGSSGIATITLTSVNSFSGTVTLTPTVSASGPQVSLNQTSITLSSGSSASAKLTAKTASSGLYSSPVSQGSYTVTVNGTSGTLSHTTTLSITVGSGSTSPSGAGTLLTPLTIGVIAAAAVIVIVTAIYLLRRKPKTSSPKLGP